jgi:hypothetical protein
MARNSQSLDQSVELETSEITQVATSSSPTQYDGGLAINGDLTSAWNRVTDILVARAKLNIDTDAAHSFMDVSDLTLVGCRAYFYKNKALTTDSQISIQGSANLHVQNRIATLSGEDFSVTSSTGEVLVAHGVVSERAKI